jgi:hypothetical protein
MLSRFPNLIFHEILIFLQPREVLITLSLVCKSLCQKIHQKSFISMYLKSYLGISLPLEMTDLIQAFKDFNSNQILSFAAGDTNGGEYKSFFVTNTYKTMWKYTPEIFSTECESNPNLPLRKNVCCFAYFTGKYKKKQFYNYIHTELKLIREFGFRFPAEYTSWRECDQTKLFVLDPLNKDHPKTTEEYRSIEPPLKFAVEKASKPIKVFIETNKIPIIKKIAAARAFLASGFLTSFLVILSKNSINASFEEFDKYNDIDNYRDTLKIGKEVQHVNNDECEFVEFEERNDEFYPLAWVCFKDWRVNHLLLELKHCHYGKFACVKLIGVEDNRGKLNLMRFQLNYDVMYTLLLGSMTNNLVD